MSRSITYSGIRTNNLKNINVSFLPNEVVLFTGPSGSGKSSLAVDTIHKISEDELCQLMGLKDEVSRYIVADYRHILPSICLKQENYNSNPRSTIATYFNLDRLFKEAFASLHAVPQRLFQFNITTSACPRCGGLGTVLAPDVLKIVDYSARVSDMPFRCWRNTEADYYHQVLEAFCSEVGIRRDIPFKELSDQEQEQLLVQTSAAKFAIRFTANGRKRRRTAIYRGPVSELREDLEGDRLKHSRRKYLSDCTCEACDGRRFCPEVLEYEVFGENLGSLYLMEADALLGWVQGQRPKWQADRRLAKPFERMLPFLENMTKLRLSYLHLNRSIPSLSGGELQRLRLAKSASSHFTNFLYVLDEPTAGMHPAEWRMVKDLVGDLKGRGNTVVLIEHNECLVSLADRVFALGPGGGAGGGEIVGQSGADDGSRTALDYVFFERRGHVQISNADYHNIVNLSIEIQTGTFVGVCGVSGSGKSSFLEGVLPRVLDNTVYLTQAPILGNAYSIVGTAVDLFRKVQDLFVRTTGKSREFFAYSSRGKGQCHICSGKGILEDSSSYVSASMVCPDCRGMRFSPKAIRHECNGANIYEFLSMDVDALWDFLPENEKAIRDILLVFRRMGLGYLKPFQRVSSLSGGEAQRIKLIDALLARKRTRVILLDEPFRGVDRGNMMRIIAFFYELVEKGFSIFMAEHKPLALSFCSYLIEFGPGGGVGGGKIIYSGERGKISQSGSSLISEHLVGL
jgi:excinuclease UvrABC ATPase subunit